MKTKNLLLATTAICAVSVFGSNASATYTPTNGENSAYKITKVDSCTPSTSANGGCFRVVDSYNEDGTPVYQYLEYTVKSGIEVAERALGADTADIIVDNMTHARHYIGMEFKPSIGASGGAIYNYVNEEVGAANIPLIISDFIADAAIAGNNSASQGGAIYIWGYTADVEVGKITGDFIGNYVRAGTSRGGALYNARSAGQSSTIHKINGNFIGNHAESSSSNEAQGGAIYNCYSSSYIGDINGDFIANYALGINKDALYYGTARGGAIYNEEGTIQNINGDFTDNYVRAGYSLGGAIYNKVSSSIGSIIGNFTTNYAMAVSNNTQAYGGAIVNGGNITSIVGNFVDNYTYGGQQKGKAYVAGGAIYNTGTIQNLTGDFIDNYIHAFYHWSGASNSVVGGGAIYNTGTIGMYVKGSSSHSNILFKGNYVQTTGYQIDQGTRYEAIYNKGSSAVMTFKSSDNGSYTFYDFIGGDNNATVNFNAESGTGVLNLYNDIKGQANVNFTGDWSLDMRSADNDETSTPYNSITAKNIVINNGLSAAIDVNFAENKTDKFNATTSGSGIITLDNINVLDTVLPTSTTIVRVLYAQTADLQLALGSAYDGADPFYIRTGLEEHIDKVTTPLNWSDVLYHTTTTYDAYGQYELSTTSTTNDSIKLTVTKQNESASTVSLGDTLALLARSTDVTAPKEFNAVAGTTTYNLGDDIGAMKGTLTVNGLEDVASTLNLNNHTGFVLGDGAVALNFNDLTVGGNTTIANVTNSSATISMDNVTLNGAITGNAASVSATDSTINANLAATAVNLTGSTLNGNISGGTVNVSNAVINMANNTAGETLTANSFNVLSNSTIYVDVDLSAPTPIMDNIVANAVNLSSGNLTVSFNVIGGTDKNSTDVQFVNVTGLTTGISIANASFEYKNAPYTVSFDPATGKFVFTNKSQNTPGRTATTKTGGAATGAATTIVGGIGSQTMGHGAVLAGMNSGDEPLGLTAWVEAFGANDDIELKHLSNKVDAQFYGLVGGIDSKRFTYDNGTSAIYGVFGSYVQGKQKLDDTKITNKSGYLGLSASLRNEALFSNFTLTGGYMANEANTPWGKDKFDTKIVSVANKTGVDVKKGAWTLTPALLLSYTGVDNDDYTAKSGTKVENHFMHIFSVAPELKVAKDLGEGLSGYAKVAYKMFFYGNDKITADDVIMPATSVKPYVEYGVGLNKDWSKAEWNAKDITSYAEINRHDGGRTGWDLNLGLKLDF